MPLQATSGAASYDGFGGGAAAAVPNFIEDVFSTYLYTGNNTTNNIVNGIDLAGKGGLVWAKARNLAGNHYWVDTARGAQYGIRSSTTGAQTTSGSTQDVTSFNSNGFSLGVGDQSSINNSGEPTVSWTFRKQPKFFDVVTFTSSASGNKTFSHNLGAVPGCVIIKNTQTNDPWLVYHRSVGDNAYLSLNSTAAQDPLTGAFSATSTTFTISSSLMYNSQTYVAYLFAHDAGGFGLSGTDNVISCGGYTGNGSFTGTVVNLGFEPQWLMVKRTNDLADWLMFDNMRGVATASAAGNGPDARLSANDAAAENSGTDFVSFTSTGFQLANDTSSINGNGSTYIYIAIRRGPMRVPTSGTSVFSPRKLYNATGTKNTTNFPVDLQIVKNYVDGGSNNVNDRLRGVSSISSEASESGRFLFTDTTAAEVLAYRTLGWDNTGFQTPGYFSNYDIIYWNFRRAPSFFDEVCYTGTGSTQNVAHNLGVIPSFIVCKRRNGAANWCALAGNSNGTYESLYLNTTVGTLYTAPSAAVAGLTATTFNPQAVFPSEVNGSGETCVAYLFGTVAGVSKVSSYTGTGTTQTINCGFTAGARFVLIKRTDDTGGWFVWDSARGIVAGNDPYLLLNSAAAEVTNTDYVDTASTGFEISSTAPAAINASGGSFIFFAVA